MKKEAEISEDGIYRYSLMRCWDTQLPTVLWVMLNPSTADAVQDDSTISCCIRFSRSWGYGSLEVGNLFAFRATDPNDLKSHPDPIGPFNDERLKDMAKRADIVIAAWGDHGIRILPGRIDQVMSLLGTEVHALNAPGRSFLTKNEQPRHPGRLPKTTKPRLWVESGT